MAKVTKQLNGTEKGVVVRRMLREVLGSHAAIEPIICACVHEHGNREWLQVSFQLMGSLTDATALSLSEKFEMLLGHITTYEIEDWKTEKPKTDRVGVMMKPIDPYKTGIYTNAERLREAQSLVKHYHDY